MSMIDLLSAYAGASLALIAAALALCGLRRFGAISRVPFRPRHLLRMGYALCLSALLLPLLAMSLPARHALLPGPVQVWSGSTMHAATAPASGDARIAIASSPEDLSVPLDVAGVGLLVMTLGALALLARLGRDIWVAQRLVSTATRLRGRGRLRVLASSAATVPFSVWLPGCSAVVIPDRFLLHPQDLRLALRHEAQHHRQGDTRLVYWLQILRSLFWWHPGAHMLVRQILELQELACDEAVIARTEGSAHAYCACLLRAAEDARPFHSRAGISMAGSRPGALLHRIQTVLHRPPAHRSARVTMFAGAAALVATGCLAMASPIRDHRLTLEDARRLAQSAAWDDGFPLVANESVLTELNRLLATPDGREWLRAGLVRMREHQPFIEAQLDQHGLPRALLAVPLVESGYRNREAGIGAGLWGFIAPTARRFGLTVSADRDERLDIALETDAAMRMLSGLHVQFQDWPLSLLAYNIGEARLEQGMREHGSRNAWQVAADRRGDANYLPRVVAAALVLANPGLHELD